MCLGEGYIVIDFCWSYPTKCQNCWHKIFALFSGCVCRSVQGDRSPPLPDSGAERECAGGAEEAVWGQSRARAPDPGTALLHFGAVPLASGVLCLQVAQQLIPAEICGSAAARTRCVCWSGLLPVLVRVPSTMCSCSFGVLWWNLCTGVFLLCYKKLLILGRDQWNLFSHRKMSSSLDLSPGQKKLNAKVTSAVWTADWQRLQFRNTVWMGHPNSQSFVVQGNFYYSSFSQVQNKLDIFLLYFLLEGHLKS